MKIITFATLVLAATVILSSAVDAVLFSQFRRSAVSSVLLPSTSSSSSTGKVKKYLKPSSSFHNYDSAEAFVVSSIPRGGANIGPITATASVKMLTILTLIQGTLFMYVPRKSLEMYGCPKTYNDDTTQIETQKFGTLVCLVCVTAYYTLSNRMTLKQANCIILPFSLMHFSSSKAAFDQLNKHVINILRDHIFWGILVYAWSRLGLLLGSTGVARISFFEHFQYSNMNFHYSNMNFQDFVIDFADFVINYVCGCFVALVLLNRVGLGSAEYDKAKRQSRHHNPICQILIEQLVGSA